ncbi:uncharacterized protein [Amphiura filiformis]|uniref:uncharacterized protein n=1 Tax=Amphiura filiformis TaxID=82378 RepID=UPI003B21B4CE
MGTNCLTACGTDTYGYNCDHQCSTTLSTSTCAGSVFCMPDPVGCSCMTGYTGPECQQTCSPGFFGAGCSQDCHCPDGVSCNTFTGVCFSGQGVCAAGWSGTNCQIPASTCLPGYYGTMCTDKCNCQCEKNTGSCTGATECLQGFYGTNCETECHCLNGAACDRDTGKCVVDITTGLSLCEPGYASSTGANFDDCQQYEGCYDSCSKTCHCSLGSSFCSETGVCTGGCDTGWTGAMCHIGIAEVSVESKVNTGESVKFHSIVMWNTVPSTYTLMLYYDSLSASPTQLEMKGMYAIANFTAQPSANGAAVTCVFQYTVNGQTGTAIYSISEDYYNLTPPMLGRPPRADNVGIASVTVSWDAWGTNAEDTGDGPVVAYNVYNVGSPTVVATVAAQQQAVYSAVVGDLTPNTLYRFYVTVEGTNGEGQPSQFVEVTTLPVTTQPTTTTNPPTTQAPTTLTPNAQTTKTTTVGNIQTTKKMTTMQAPVTDSATDRTRPSDRRTTATDSGVLPGDMTTGSDAQTRSTATTQASGGGTGAINGIQLPIIIVVIVSLALILIFIIAVIWFLKKKRSRVKRYPPSIVASEADLDRLSAVFPTSPSASIAEISTLDGIDNLGLDIDETSDSHRPTSMPPLAASSMETPPSVRGRPTSGGLVTHSIKTRLRIPPVNVKDFANYVRAKRQTTDLRVEWESLPKDLARPTTIAKKPENKGKNRYRNVVAYDHSRVVLEPLDEDPDSDYVNACYIKEQFLGFDEIHHGSGGLLQ